ncbi:hexapeptide transferase [Paenibacillus selenitireducens]|uniref:Hexapeptide transferase n=1 Tax=Paenibacillus selenitireducens TaxID=1324314 RepID=A0A1T2XK02_9BACL|nr:acetyltransferase [Paenibacillus selenitireducens]OPA80199.1 hexapeptide transferase [Paenibacillus selenitireducens]
MAIRCKVVIIGAGGHAKVVIDMIQSNPEFEIIGCTDRIGNRKISGIPVLGDDSILPQLYEQGIRHAFVAIGGNSVRHQLARHALDTGFELINAISPHAYVADSVILGSGIAVMPGAVLNAEACIGNNSIINTCASVDHECYIGETCHIAPGCNISGNVRIGEGTFLGTGTKVIDGMTIGSWSILGSGAVVVKDIPSYCLAVGVPAKIIKKLT